jgi:DnaK suppressor protein
LSSFLPEFYAAEGRAARIAPLGTTFAASLAPGWKSSAVNERGKNRESLMNAEKLKQFRKQLVHLRERVGGEVNNVVHALQEEINIDSNVSNAPVHLADVAPSAVDADVEVLQTERGMLEQINDALERIERGEFGVCQECAAKISEERLKALPYAPLCVTCARGEAETQY